MAYTYVRSSMSLMTDINDLHNKVSLSAQQERFRLLKENHWTPVPVNGSAAWKTAASHLHELGIPSDKYKHMYSEEEALWLECKAIVFGHIWREVQYDR